MLGLLFIFGDVFSDVPVLVLDTVCILERQSYLGLSEEEFNW